jgi:hypothetical protein
MSRIRHERQAEVSNDDITLAQREDVFVEGKRAFKERKWRICNPYTTSSPTLEQVWMNGWDQGRRLQQWQDRRLPKVI